MKFTFQLKEPKSQSETLIFFVVHLKHEHKKFKYSTGEKIAPENWDFINKFPFGHGKNKSKSYNSIRTQLNRYSDLFLEIVTRCKQFNQELMLDGLKLEFDSNFKRIAVNKNHFFESYDKFMKEKIEGKEWASSTIKRYENIKNLLKEFEIKKKYKLSFNSIDQNFHRKLTTFCLDDLNHINNTYARNLGLIKTFLFWAKKEKLTNNEAFLEFKKVDRVITNQIALTLEDLNKLMEFDFKNNRLEKVKDVFVFACVTGMRFGELSLITKSNVNNDYIVLKEEKDVSKEARNIPLTTLSKHLLKKYDYKLPLIANQKQNLYIKEVFKAMDYSNLTQKVTTQGKKNIKEDLLFYERISTHTARRTFITMMKRQGKSDKLISKITGHTDLKTLNQYYQVDNEQTKEAMDDVFKIDLKLKVV